MSSTVKKVLFRPIGERLVGDYRVIETVAEGGMSTIFKAEDRSKNLFVALKVLKPDALVNLELHDGIRPGELDSEGAIAIQLDHPNIIHTYEYGRDKNEYFIVMELLESFTLKYLIYADSPLVARQKYDLIAQIGEGIAYMHQAGFLHRDICPRNVLVDGKGVPKLIDFGLAIPKAAAAKRRDLRSGTPSYMSPEQVRGQELDERSDVYSFGITVYEILTGKLPFRSDVQGSELSKHLSGFATPPRRYDPTLPTRIEAIVLKAIERDAPKRYPTMRQVLAEIRAAVPDQVLTPAQRAAKGQREVRRFKRLNVECFLKFKPVGSWSPLSYRTLTRNISVNGASCLFRRRELPVGTRLNAHLQLRGAKSTIPLEAEVAWARATATAKGYELGLRFIRIADEHREQILQYIAAKAKRET